MTGEECYSTIMNSGQSWAIDRANYAMQIHNAVLARQMSPDEARELLTDLIDTQKLDEASSDMQLRSLLVFGVTQVITMLG
jgi:hypothetical protein